MKVFVMYFLAFFKFNFCNSTLMLFFRRRLAIALPKVAGAANMNNNAEVETKSLMTIAC